MRCEERASRPKGGRELQVCVAYVDRGLVAAWTSQGIDERAGTRRIVPYLERRVEVEDVGRSESAAGAVDGEHRVAIDFVEVDVFQHGAAPVRQVEEVDAGLIGVHAGLDRDAAHGFAAAEEQKIGRASCRER